MTLYALATLFAVLIAPPHAEHDHGAFLERPSISGAICLGQQDKAGKTGPASVCCDMCNLAASGGLEPPPVATLLVRHEIATRMKFEQRLGLAADARPDDLRSRAPPAG